MDISGRLEEIILNQLVKNRDFFKEFIQFIEPEYFNDETEKRLFGLIADHFKKYDARITPQILAAELAGITGINQDKHDESQSYIREIILPDFDPPTLKWLTESVDAWCADRCLENAIYESVNIFQGNNKTMTRGMIPDMIKKSLSKTRDVNIGHDFIADREARWKKVREEESKIPFDIEILNLVTKNGLSKKTLNAVVAGTGVGKALRHGEKVIVPGGTKNIEDMQLGDTVAGSNGWTVVTGVFPQGERDIYRVSFSDGTHLDVDGDHLWTMNHQKKGTTTLKTLEMMSNYRRNDGGKMYSLPQYAAIEYTTKKLPINPYVLGAWLGDGSNYHGHICCPKGKLNESNIGEFSFNADYDRYNIKDLQKQLKSLGMLQNKHIPDEYFYGNVQQRTDLLKGLLDTDGHDQGKRGYAFDNTNELLVDGVIKLARSLGYIAYRYTTKSKPFYRNADGEKVICNPCYRARIKHPDARTAKRYVSDISYIGKFQATCISVDAPDKLFIAGDFIPTHNTIFLCHVAASTLSQGKNVLYLSAEMDEYQLANRIDANILDLNLDALADTHLKDYMTMWEERMNIMQYKQKSFGKLIIKQYPTATASVTDFRAYLTDLEVKMGFKPDLIIIDYLNIFRSSRISMGSNIGLYGYVKAIAEEFRGLAIEYDVPVLTATQVNRSGADSSDFGIGATSESMGLAHTLDLFLAMIDPEDDSSTSLKIMFKQLKNRYGSLSKPARKFYIGLDKSKMKFFDVDDWKVNQPKSGKKTITKKKEETKPDVPLFDKSMQGMMTVPIPGTAPKFNGIEV